MVGRPDEVHLKISVNNDVEAIFEAASSSESQIFMSENEQMQYSFLFQKLTADELQLVQKKESNNIDRFARYRGTSKNVETDEIELENSESESRYAFLYCLRKTLMLQNTYKHIYSGKNWRRKVKKIRKQKSTKKSKKKTKRKLEKRKTFKITC